MAEQAGRPQTRGQNHRRADGGIVGFREEKSQSPCRPKGCPTCGPTYRASGDHQRRGPGQKDYQHEAVPGRQLMRWGEGGGWKQGWQLELWDSSSRADIRHHNPRLYITALTSTLRSV